MTDRPTDWLDLTSYLIMCTLKPILCNFGHFYLKFAGWLKGRLELLQKIIQFHFQDRLPKPKYAKNEMFHLTFGWVKSENREEMRRGTMAKSA